MHGAALWRLLATTSCRSGSRGCCCCENGTAPGALPCRVQREIEASAWDVAKELPAPVFRPWQRQAAFDALCGQGQSWGSSTYAAHGMPTLNGVLDGDQ